MSLSQPSRTILVEPVQAVADAPAPKPPPEPEAASAASPQTAANA